MSADAGGDPFTSTLSVADFSFATGAGLEPLAAVHGAHVRWLSQPLPVPDLPSRRTWRVARAEVLPVGKLDAEINYVRGEVLGELTKQAMGVGADAVIAIRQLPGVIDWSDTSSGLGRRLRSPGPRAVPHLVRPMEYQLIGTAVRDPDDRSPRPRLSTLSAADTWKLRRKGWRATG